MSTTEQTSGGQYLKLMVEDDEGVKASYPILLNELTVGRSPESAVCLPQRDISRQHARLLLQEDKASLLVRDLDSFTGVRLNGKRIFDHCTFRVGDLIEIGSYVFSLQTPEVVDPKSAPVVKHEVEKLPPSEHAKLVAVSSNLAGRVFMLDKRELIIGREAEDNDIVIPHRSISRNHAKIVWRDSVFTVIDQGSINHLFVNGAVFRSAPLVNGDVIKLGHVKLRFVAPGDPYTFSPADVEQVTVEQGGQTRLIVLIAALALLAWFAGQYMGSADAPKTPSLSPEAPQGQGAQGQGAQPPRGDEGVIAGEGTGGTGDADKAGTQAGGAQKTVEGL
jgi:pSer/pThr/pTyr-binding forkhead associated (FHA) protein